MQHDDEIQTFARRVPDGLVGLAVGVVVVQVASLVVFGGGIGYLSTWSAQLSLLLTTVFAVPVFGGGLWLRRSRVSPARFPRLAAWTVAVLLVILAINVVMIFTWPQTFVQNVAWGVQAAAMGAAGGVLFGSIEARAIERALAAERARIHADHVESRHEWLEYLNSLLRHEVLNTANVITGYSEMVLADFQGDDQIRERLERIGRQSQKMTEVIQDVRLLLQSADESVEFEPVDVTAVLERELSSLEDRHPEVAVEAALSETAYVTADDLVGRIFSNLLSNAVEHNDGDAPTVRVSIDTAPDVVRVVVADDGPGFSEHARETLFEQNRRGNHGLGLYLVARLVDRYDGTIDLVETGPDGSTLAVELPRAEAPMPAIDESSALTINAV